MEKRKTKAKIEITPGEAADRYAIAIVKAERVTDPARKQSAMAQYRELWAWLDTTKLFDQPGFPGCVADLVVVHKQLWDVENKIREYEASYRFNVGFISAARSVYILNDKRTRLKQDLDEQLGFTPEVKEYSPYPSQGGDHGQEKSEESTDTPRRSCCPGCSEGA
jgi:hypothetical protein